MTVEQQPQSHILKVSARSAPASVAGAIAGLVKDGNFVEIQCVGAAAVNQAVKSIALSRSFLVPSGIDISAKPYFTDIDIEGSPRTAIRFNVVVEHLSSHKPTHR